LSEYALGDTTGLEEAVSVNGKVSNRQKLFANGFATSNSEQFSEIFDMRMLSKAVFEVLNLGVANGLKYTVYGAIDPSIKWEPLPDAVDQVLAAGVSKVWALTDAYAFVRVGVVSNVAGNSTTPQVLAEGKSH
jgi:hypothetical protein